MSNIVPQLDGSPHAGDNCGPASVAEAMRWATDHDVAPSPSQIRRLMGDREGGTTMDEHKIAWDKMIDDARRDGWIIRPMAYRGVAPIGDLVNAVRNGKGATVALDYSRVPKPYRRSRTFMGNHAVFIAQMRIRAGKQEFKVLDPLADGRHADAPRGPIWYPRDLLVDALEGVTRRAGHGFYNVVQKGRQIAHDPQSDRAGEEPTNGVRV